MTRAADVGARVGDPRLGLDHVALGVGVVTLGMGVALVVAPARAAQVLGLQSRVALARSLGVADLLLAPALLRVDRRGRAMACRAALNAVIAGVYLDQTRRPGSQGRAKLGLASMVLLTVFDGCLATVLLRSPPGQEGAGGAL